MSIHGSKFISRLIGIRILMKATNQLKLYSISAAAKVLWPSTDAWLRGSSQWGDLKSKMNNLLTIPTNAMRFRLFKHQLKGKTYRSTCRTHFDVPYWDVADILSVDAPQNILINISEIFEASEKDFGGISFSILNVTENCSRVYVHSIIPMNFWDNLINSMFLAREKEIILKSSGAVVHYIFKQKDSYNLTYSIESVPNQFKRLISRAMSFDLSINNQVMLRIAKTLNKSLY